MSTHLHRLIKRLAASSPVAWFLARNAHHADRLVLRLSGGRSTLTRLLAGVPVVMVTVRGARSGASRTVPLLPIRDTSDPHCFALIASNFGQHHFPAWYFNLKAHPRATCVIAGETGHYMAHEATGAEYERFWRCATDTYPGYALYKQRAGRRIPIMVMVAENSK